ncbi:MAG: ATP-binding protein [Candidatus Hodarchaeales archaeon]|jgi:hypothetical protein
MKDSYAIDCSWLLGIIEEKNEHPLYDFKAQLTIHASEKDVEKKSRAEFIRDIISLANMAAYSGKKSYLIIGVSDGKITGMYNDYDDNIFQSLVSSLVAPNIDFLYKQLEIENKTLGVFVILPRYDRVFTVSKDYTDSKNKLLLKEGDTWIRRGTSKHKVRNHQELLSLQRKFMRETVRPIIVNKILGPSVGSMIGYFNLTQYGGVLLKACDAGDSLLADRTGSVRYSNEQDYWRDVIGPYFFQPSVTKLHPDTIVELKNFHLTEWFPRCPGTIWTSKARELRKEAQKHLYRDRDVVSYGKNIGFYAPAGKTYMVIGGLGTTRLGRVKMPNTNITYRILCATSSGFCDKGIPVIVAEDVYKMFSKLISTEGAIQADIIGLYTDLPFNWIKTTIRLPGVINLTRSLKEHLAKSLYVPKTCIVLHSRNQVDNIQEPHIEDISATAWTFFKQRRGYSFTFGSFIPKDEESIVKAADFIMDYVYHHGGREIYTDFDRRVQRLESLASQPFSQYEFRRRIRFRTLENPSDILDPLIRWGHTLEGDRFFIESLLEST